MLTPSVEREINNLRNICVTALHACRPVIVLPTPQASNIRCHAGRRGLHRRKKSSTLRVLGRQGLSRTRSLPPTLSRAVQLLSRFACAWYARRRRKLRAKKSPPKRAGGVVEFMRHFSARHRGFSFPTIGDPTTDFQRAR